MPTHRDRRGLLEKETECPTISLMQPMPAHKGRQELLEKDMKCPTFEQWL